LFSIEQSDENVKKLVDSLKTSVDEMNAKLGLSKSGKNEKTGQDVESSLVIAQDAIKA